MIKFIKNALRITAKDLKLEFNTKEIMSSMFIFALLVVIVFSFIFEPGKHEVERIAGGTYWMALIFAGLLGLGKSMQSEISGANLEALLLTPISRVSIFYGKVLSNLIFMVAMQIVMVPLFMILYEVHLFSGIFSNPLPNIMMLVVLGGTTYGFVLLGTLFSLMAARSRTREILLPILLLPILIPLILAAIQATNSIIFGVDVGEYSNWIRLIIVFDVIFTALATVLFDAVVEE